MSVSSWNCPPSYINFPRRRIYASTINELFDADLAELPDLFVKANNGVRYLLVVVDVCQEHGVDQGGLA